MNRLLLLWLLLVIQRTVSVYAPSISSPGGGSFTTDRPKVRGSGERFATITVYFDDILDGTTTVDFRGVWSYIPFTPLTPGSHQVKATATDAVGDVSPDSSIKSFNVGSLECAPHIEKPGPISLADLTPPTPRGGDLVDGVHSTAPSGDFPIGLTPVLWTATIQHTVLSCVQNVIVTADADVPDNVILSANYAPLTPPLLISSGLRELDLSSPGSIVAENGRFSFGQTFANWVNTEDPTDQQQQSVVIIKDTTPPTFTCPGSVTASITQVPGIVDIGVPTNLADSYDNLNTAADPLFPYTTGDFKLSTEGLLLFATGPNVDTEAFPADARAARISCVNNASADGFQLGYFTIQWTCVDGANNPSICYQTVRVNEVDTVAPVITCPNAVVRASTVPIASYTFSIGYPSVIEAHGYSLDDDRPNFFPLGVTTVHWIATDSSGNFDECDQTVTVTEPETVAPEITCPDAITVFSTTPVHFSTVTLGEPTATDANGVTGITNNRPWIFPVGVTTIRWIATDPSGNTAGCDQTVTVTDVVVDGVAPEITCPAAVTQLATQLPVPATDVTLGAATATDANGATITDDRPTSFSLGVTTVHWTATDPSGNSAECDQTITIEVAPEISCPAAVTHLATQLPVPATDVTLGDATATDADEDPNGPGATITDDRPTSFTLGVTIVTWTATDANGHFDTCEQTVTVEVAPEITCPAAVTHLADQLPVPATDVTLGEATATDADEDPNGPGATITDDRPTSFTLGVTTVTWTATDANGHFDTCEQSVTVEVAPEITCPADVITLTASFPVPATAVTLDAATATDADGDLATITDNRPTSYPMGVTIVQWTATDSRGHTDTCDQSVTVKGCATLDVDVRRSNVPISNAPVQVYTFDCAKSYSTATLIAANCPLVGSGLTDSTGHVLFPVLPGKYTAIFSATTKNIDTRPSPTIQSCGNVATINFNS